MKVQSVFDKEIIMIIGNHTKGMVLQLPAKN